MTKEFNIIFAEDPDFYNSYVIRFLEANETDREACKDHWTTCHAANIKAHRDDLTIFSGKILASISIAEKIIDEQRKGG